jgi:hypothetical protein
MTISSQIHRNHRKNHNIDQNTWPVPNSATTIYLFLLDAMCGR